MGIGVLMSSDNMLLSLMKCRFDCGLKPAKLTKFNAYVGSVRTPTPTRQPLPWFFLLVSIFFGYGRSWVLTVLHSLKAIFSILPEQVHKNGFFDFLLWISNLMCRPQIDHMMSPDNMRLTLMKYRCDCVLTPAKQVHENGFFSHVLLWISKLTWWSKIDQTYPKWR